MSEKELINKIAQEMQAEIDADIIWYLRSSWQSRMLSYTKSSYVFRIYKKRYLFDKGDKNV